MLLNIKSAHIFIILTKIQLKPGRQKQQTQAGCEQLTSENDRAQEQDTFTMLILI